MHKHPFGRYFGHIGILVFCGLAGLAPLRADWTSFVPAARARRVAGGVEYRGARGAVLVTVIQPGVIRVRMTPGSKFAPEDSYAVLPEAIQSKAAFEFSSAGSSDRIRTSELTLEIQRRPFRLRFLDKQGRTIDRDTDAMGMAYDPDGRVRVWKDLPANAHYFGFGEKTGSFDKRGPRNSGSSMVMWNTDTFAYDNTTDPIYAAIPFFMTLQNGAAHGTFFDNTWRTSFDVGRQSHKSVNFGAEGGDLDYYTIAGPTPAEVLRRYMELTGPIPLPPLWALGYHQCRYSYYPDTRVMEVARGFRERRIPADSIWLDIDYMDGYRIFTWDPKRFPQPGQMLRDLAAMNFKTVTIVDPGVKLDPGFSVYDDGVKAGVFAKMPDGKLFSGRVWPGTAVFPDFTEASARNWWAGKISDFVKVGLAGIWIDMNEPAVFDLPGGTAPEDVVFRHNGAAVSHAQIHNVYGQQMSVATRQGLLNAAPGLRPFVLTRATYSGGQRYAAAWTGDNVADWAHFKEGLGTLLGMGVSGFPFVGNDVGGFDDTAPGDAGLFTRWIQAGAFFPFMRGHTVPQAANKEPWAFGPEDEVYNRHAIERRYRFLPYLYNAFYEASLTGMPVMRALMLQYPRDEATYDVADEFLVGPDLLVAPILAAKSTAREVYLPSGAWYDLRTDAAMGGGKKISVSAGPDELPLFAAEGAILFEASAMQSTNEWAASELTFDVFSHGSTERDYYEDDGTSFAYRQNAFFLRKVSVQTAATGATVVLGAAQGTFAPRHAANLVRLHFAKAPRAVTLDGQALPAAAAQFDASRATLTIRVPQSGARQTIAVSW